MSTFKKSSATRQSVTVVILVVVTLFAGVLIGSLSSVGRTLRGWVYSSRGDLDFDTAQEIYGILAADFDGSLDRAALQDGANAGVVAATGDKFSSYLTPGEWTAFQKRMRGGTVGIGVELGFKNGELVIIAPQEGSPAKRAGLQSGDRIIRIDGTRVSDVSEQEAVSLLRGTAGTAVELTVLRGSQELEFAVTRQAIVIPSVRSSVTDDNIGVLTITTFDSNTAKLARTAAENFRTQNVRGIILDMRGNPGGAVTAARDVAALWLPKGSMVMTEKRGDTVLRTYKTETAPVLSGINTIVLMNGGSASASEVVAGALQDYSKATVAGVQSFGKGSVQEVRQLSNGGALSFTVSRWFTSQNRTIDGVGIAPDEVVSAGDGDNDAQLDAALQLLLE